MFIDELQENASEAGKEIREWGEATAEYYRLKTFKISLKGLLFIMKGMILGTFAFLFLVFVSISGALALGRALGSVSQGFLLIGLAYLLAVILAYVFRKALDGPVLKKFSEYYFEE